MGNATQLNLLQNTVFIYTSDNGYHIGQHRLPAGKSCAYEEDINVPFFIRGPGIAAGRNVTSPTSHTDIAPTLFELAGLIPRSDFDGIAMPVKDNASCIDHTPDRRGCRSYHDGAGTIKQEHINVEFWGSQLGEGQYGASLVPLANNDTYKALRLLSADFNLAYVAWCTNERELYEMNSDPYQVINLANAVTVGSTAPYNNANYIKRLQDRVDTLLMVTKTCKGKDCVQPWRVVHSDGAVNSLKDAMDPKYDTFYRNQPKITFLRCAQGYIRELEGPGADRGDVKAYPTGSR